MDIFKKVKWIRQQVLEMIVGANKGHIGGSFSCVEILTALYYSVLRDDDKFILSKGHACPALYAILADKGYFYPSELKHFCQHGSRLEGHPNRRIPGIDVTTGSLGHGLGIGAGMALAGKNAYVLMGDGECQEGSVWETALFAGANKLNNLTAIIDRNGLGAISEVDLEPLAYKWRAFRWEVREVDGHNVKEISHALNRHRMNSHPLMIIAHTIKGKGVSFMENNPKFHNAVPQGEEVEIARRELGGH